MKRWAIIEDNKVINVTIGEQLDPSWVECPNDDIAIGWSYDDEFHAPEPVIQEEVPPVRISTISKLDYMDRFTNAELAGIYTAAKQSIQVEVWLEKFKLATHIDLDDPRTISGVHSLEAAGLIGQGRAEDILT
jgi:hypothetical protein